MPLSTAIDCLKAFDPEQLEMSELQEALRNSARLKAMAEAAWLKVVARVEALSAAKEFGYRTTAGLITATTGDRRGKAMSDIDLGTQLHKSPATSNAFANGEISRNKAAEIVRGSELLSSGQQSELLAMAKTSTVKQLHDKVTELLAEQGIERRPVTNTASIQHGDGGGTLTATLEPIRMNLLEIALDMAIKKLRLPTDIPYDQRRAEALVAMAKFFVEHIENTSHVRGSRPHISALVDIDTIAGRANKSARLENGQYITGEAARRLCCDAGITRIVAGPKSQPLDVGTETRNFPAPMAKAIIARDKHCVHPGCEAPPWACDIHHIIHVEHHGPTSAENGELRCWFHHDHQHEKDRQLRLERARSLEVDSYAHAA
jgi:hypothetical protein